MGLIKMYARPIKYKVNGPGTEETADGFVATPVRYSTISVEDLADHISADSRVERSKVAVITDSLIKQIREMVLNGHKIIIPHLGAFKPKIKSNLAINPESVDASSFTAKVQFMPSVELKRDLQASRIEKTTLPTAPETPTIEAQKTAIQQKTLAEGRKVILAKYPAAEPEDFQVVLTETQSSIDPTKKLVIAQCYVDADVSASYYKVIKTRDVNAMGRYYSTFDGTGKLTDAPMPTAGWNDKGQYWADDFFKVSEPFTI